MATLRLKDRVLLGLAIGGEVVSKLSTGAARAYLEKRLWYWTPPKYSRKNYKHLLRRLMRNDEIERIVDNQHKLHYRIKGEGKRTLLEQFPHLRFSQQKWDGFWRIVIFDVPESKRYQRDQLRQYLDDLGFGQLQRSVYITPYDFDQDLMEFFKLKGLWGKVVLLEAKQKYLGNPRDVADKVWGLEKLNQEYQKVVDKLTSQFGLQDLKQRQRFFKACCQRYLKTLTKDPFLPQEILPKNWQGQRAQELLLKALTVLK